MPDAPGPRTFRSDIQGLRGIAVALVVLFHASLPGLGGGYVGVDVFFVISGFLITSHLLVSVGETGRIDIPGFFARRARRILPASFAVLIATVLASFFVVSPLRLEQVLSDAIATALYIPNVAFAVQDTDYLHGAQPSPFQHYWSLGVEEQFYLLWPAVLILVAALVRRRWRPATLAIAMAAVVAVSFLSCMLTVGTSQPWAFFSLTTRAWELAIGGMLAATVRYAERVPRVWAAIGGWAGLVAVVASGFLITADTTSPGFATAVPVLGAAAILWFGATESSGPARLLSARPLVFIGMISYSLYLVHWPLRVLVGDAIDSPVPLALSLGLAALSVPLAWALYRLVEKPGRVATLARLPARTTLLTTLGASGAMLIVLVAAIPAAEAMPRDAGRTAVDAELEVSPPGTAYVPSNLRPTLDRAVSDTGALYDGCEQGTSGSEVVTCEFGDPASSFTIALFGDSHAGRWFPALERVAIDRHVRLVTYVKSGCRSEDTDAAWSSTKSAACTAWRAAALAALAENPPDLIILANHTGPDPGQDPHLVERQWRSGIDSSLRRLPASSRIVTLADTPEFPSPPAMCLSAHLQDAGHCAVPRAAAFNSAIASAQRAEADRLGSGYLDLTDYLCNADLCPAIIGATLAYADEHHLTGSFSVKLAPPLEGALAPYLPTGRAG